MNTNTNNTVETKKNPLDVVLMLAALAILVAGIYANYRFEKDYGGLVRALGLIGVVAVSGVLVYLTEKGKALWNFFGASRNEVRKVVWPTKDETIQTTIIVIVMVFIVGIMLWLMDWFFSWGFQMITGQGS